MTKTREVKSDHGIQGEVDVHCYDVMQRHLRNKGWIETDELIRFGIIEGKALEIGPGPGYLGLEWLAKTAETTLTGLEISDEMIRKARSNAAEYELNDRVDYQPGNVASIPFAAETFDAVFTNGSLHEWSNPLAAFDEIHRVLKSGGRFFISDLRRDMAFALRWFLWLNTRPKELRPGLITSIDAAYTPGELRRLIDASKLAGAFVKANIIGITITGKKA
jgi:ubiquinone/menaquinone biosynthesis C-methylase UbiE